MPIIVLSACAFEPDRQGAQRAGCDAFLSKPCLPDELLAQMPHPDSPSQRRAARTKVARHRRTV